MVSETSLLTNEFSYTGAISDSTTGLTYLNARYYNPATGSFTSQDTYLGSAYNPQSQHLYSYTGGNPINFIDPTGHRFDEDFDVLNGNASGEEFCDVYGPISHSQSRVVEQSMMLYYDELKPGNYPYNQINGLSPTRTKNYLLNQLSNEYLNFLESGGF